jgi:hypothetical protein
VNHSGGDESDHAFGHESDVSTHDSCRNVIARRYLTSRATEQPNRWEEFPPAGESFDIPRGQPEFDLSSRGCLLTLSGFDTC